jgi:hypothetical protein
MRVATLLTAITVMEAAFAWNSITEMESCVCIALTNDDYLASGTFANQLNSVSLSASDEMTAGAYMLLSVNDYRKFLHTVDEMWFAREMSNASNAVVAIGNNSSRWQFWNCRCAESNGRNVGCGTEDGKCCDAFSQQILLKIFRW